MLGNISGVAGSIWASSGCNYRPTYHGGWSRSCYSICNKGCNCCSLYNLCWLHSKSSLPLKNSIYSKAHLRDHYQRFFSNGSRHDSPVVRTGSWGCGSCNHTFRNYSCVDSATALDHHRYPSSSHGIVATIVTTGRNSIYHFCLELSESSGCNFLLAN